MFFSSIRSIVSLPLPGFEPHRDDTYNLKRGRAFAEYQEERPVVCFDRLVIIAADRICTR